MSILHVENKPPLRACTIKHYGFVINRSRCKSSVFISKAVEITDNYKDTNTLHDVFIFRTLRIGNVL